MNEVTNPYSPGAGTRPYEVTGRNNQVQAMDVTLQRLLLGRSGRGQLLTGLRGISKTVLPDEFSRSAGRLGYLHEHIEISEDGKLPLRRAAAVRKVLLKLDMKKRVGEAAARALGTIKALTLALPDGTSLNIDVPAYIPDNRFAERG